MLRERLGQYELSPAPADLPAVWVRKPGARAVTRDWLAAYAFRDRAEPDLRTKLEKMKAAELDVMAPSWAMDATITVPAPPGKTYRPYQLAGIAYAMQRHSTLIADVPRLGKSMQALGVCNLTPGRVVIVCPAVAKPQWAQYCRDWLVSSPRVQVVQGHSDVLTGDVLIINWEILDSYAEELAQRKVAVVVFDECRAMAKERSKRTRAALRISAVRRLFLDGTPINTRPFDLWPVVQACDPKGLGARRDDFAMRYCDARRIPGEWNPDGASNMEELQRRMRAAFMVRREKTDVIDDITTTRQMVWLPDTELQRLLDQERTALTAGDDRPLTEILEAWADEARPETEALATAREALGMAKLPYVFEYVDHLLTSVQKVIIFAYHRAVTTAIAAHYSDSAVIIGGLTPAQREAARIRFQTDPNCRVFVGNITACNSAISLAAADDVVYGELSWIPTEMEQSEERPWLPEKKNPLTMHWLMFENSMDGAMHTILTRRIDDIHKALDRHHIV